MQKEKSELQFLRRTCMAIKRIWHGWTTPENADIYQNLLHSEVFPGIEAKKISGDQSTELFRRDLGKDCCWEVQY